MKKIKYTNRYNDVFTFTKTDDGNILFEGEFKWMRCSWPNVYDRAYEAYCMDIDDDQVMTLGEFKKASTPNSCNSFSVTKLVGVLQQLLNSPLSIPNIG